MPEPRRVAIGRRALAAARGLHDCPPWHRPGVRWAVAPWAHLSDAQASLIRVETILAALPDEITRRMERLIMATDRDTITRVLAVLPVILAHVRGAIADSQAKDAKLAEANALIADLRGQLGQAQEAADTDEDADTTALAPLEEAVAQLAQVIVPAANENPEVTPVPVLDEVAPVLSGQVDPGAGGSETVAPEVDLAATAEPVVSSDDLG